MTTSAVWVQISTGTRGATGPSADTADKGAWSSGINIYENDKYSHTRSGHGLSVYRCKLDHLSSSTNEPEMGVNRATYWELWNEGGTNGAGSGDVVSNSVPSVAGHLAVYHDTAGKEIEDSLIPKTQVNFNDLTESTLALVNDTDFICAYIASLGAYRKVSARKFGRKTECMIIPAQAFWARESTGCSQLDFIDTAVTHRSIPYLSFSETATSFANCHFVTPRNYDGLGMTIRFYWFLHTTTVGSVCWGAYAHCVGNHESLDGADAAAATTVDSSDGTADNMLITDAVALTIGGVAGARKGITLQVLREPSLDTLEESAYFNAVEIEYGVTE